MGKTTATRRGRVLSIVALGAIITGSVGIAAALIVGPTAQASEDDPGWDCRTMGNRTCGVESDGTHYLVAFDADGRPESVSVKP